MAWGPGVGRRWGLWRQEKQWLHLPTISGHTPLPVQLGGQLCQLNQHALQQQTRFTTWLEQWDWPCSQLPHARSWPLAQLYYNIMYCTEMHSLTLSSNLVIPTPTNSSLINVCVTNEIQFPNQMENWTISLILFCGE